MEIESSIESMDGRSVGVYKKVKLLLLSVANHHVFIEEALVIILYEIRSILNQRQLTAIRDNCKHFEVLTPSHSLIGAYSPNLLSGIFINSEMNH